MRVLTVVRALGPIDARSIARDSFLVWMLPLPLAIGVLLRWAVPALAAWLDAELGFDLTPYYPVVLGYLVVLLGPALVGSVVGFLLLDERDDDTLTALLVTPLPVEAYLAWRVGLPLALCTALVAIAAPLTGLAPLPWASLGPVAALAALEAPLLALTLASLAANKVQGFALMKALGAVLMIPVAAWFVDEPWQYAAGLVPSYWPLKAYWVAVAGEPGYWIYMGLGALYHAALLAVLLRAFRRALRG